MLQELFKLVSDQAVKAAKAHVGPVPGEPPHVYGIYTTDGNVTLEHCPSPHPRQHHASSLDAILQYVNSAATPSAIWFNRSKVVGVLDDNTRRDILTLELQASPQLLSLQEIKRDTKFTQEQLIRFLRINMDGCQVDADVIKQLRKINWKMAQDSASEISRTKTSLGKTIEAQALGIEALPETVTLIVPIFNNLYTAAQAIRCAIEPNVAKSEFEFIPFPGEIENAIQHAEQLVGNMLRSGLDHGDAETPARDVKVCYGQP